MIAMPLMTSRLRTMRSVARSENPIALFGYAILECIGRGEAVEVP